MTNPAQDQFPRYSAETNNQDYPFIPATPEIPPQPEALVCADGAAMVSRDPTDVDNRYNEDSIVNVEGKNTYGIFDGVGGHEDGQGASSAASQAIGEYFSERLVPRTEDEAFRLMKGAMMATRTAVFTEGLNKMTTGTITQIYEDRDNGPSAVIGHAGDSRAYILRAQGGRLQQLTRDHGHENYVNNSFGGKDKAHALDDSKDQIIIVPLQKGDRLMLCTDGITGDFTSQAFTNEELANALSTGTPTQAAIEVAKLSLTDLPGWIYKDEKGVYHASDVANPDYDSYHRQYKKDDKTVIVVEIGGAEATGANPESSSTQTQPDASSKQLGRAFMRMSGVLIQPPANLPKPEQRVVKGFPDSQGGKVGMAAGALEKVLNNIRRPGEPVRLIDSLIEAAQSEQSEIGYAANGTNLRDSLINEVTQLVAHNNRVLQVDPTKSNLTVYNLGILLRSFKPLNKDLVTSTEWEKATAFYRSKGGDALKKHQINMADKFFDQIEALSADPAMKDTEPVKRITSLFNDLLDALGANAPWDGVKPTAGSGGDIRNSRMLAIMNGDKGALLQGGKENVTLTSAQMDLITYLANRLKVVSDPGSKKKSNPDFIAATSGLARTRIMLAEELLDTAGVEAVLGMKIDPKAVRRPHRDIQALKEGKKTLSPREVYEKYIIPRRTAVLGMNRDTIIALLKDDVGAQGLMTLLSNANDGPLRKKLLVQTPPPPTTI